MVIEPKDQGQTARDAAHDVAAGGGLPTRDPMQGTYAVAHDAWMEGYYYGLSKALECERPVEVAELAEEAAETLEGIR